MDPTLIAAAKAYAYRLEIGKTPTQAEAYLNKEFPALKGADLALVIAQANQAISVGYNLANLPPDAQLRDALLGAQEPAPTVGVRVVVIRSGMGDVNKAGQAVPRYNTVYLPMSWDATVADVLAAVEEYAEDHWSLSGEPSGIGFQFVGPTLWPLQ